MTGKSVEWSREEIRAVIQFLHSVGCGVKEICLKIWQVCGFHSVSTDEVCSILAADKQAKAAVSGRVDISDVFPADDIEISNFLELYNEDIFNYPVQSSEYRLNQWNSSWKELYSRECCPKAQHDPAHVKKTTNEVRDKVLCEKLNDIFENFSPQNFSVLASEIKKLGITTESNLNEVIDIVFEKAVEKPDFSIPYANLCKLLSLLKVPCSGRERQFIDIRDLLVTKCQKELGKDEVNQLCREGKSKPIQGEKERVKKIDEEKWKRRQLGTARFMGWMFKLDIFTETMMHQVINSLLLQAGEVATQCICLLVLAIGSELDGDKVESYISDLKRTIDTHYANTRLETIVQQISDLKMNNWVPYENEKRNKIIDEILSEDQEKEEKIPVQIDHPSPQSPVEVKQYSRKFLLNLQSHLKSVRRPDDLPDLDRLKIKDSSSPGEEMEAKDMKESAAEETPKNQITLKYNYKEDQWSPLNPEGKKQYDGEFLLNLQFHPVSMKKPSNLPNLDIVKDKAILHTRSEKKNRKASAAQYQPRRANYVDPFETAFARTNASARLLLPAGIKVRGSIGREHKPPQKVFDLNTSEDQQVKLHTAENAWVPSRKTETEQDNAGTQDIYKKVRGILNKLTPQKFATLMSQVKRLDITTEESLSGVIDMIFEKAIAEPNFSALYANMCKHLALIKVASSVKGQFVSFRKLLPTRCQREFEKVKTGEQNREERMRLIQECETGEKKRQLQKDFREAENNRRRQLGCIRFIGELFNFGMLTESIMHQCIKKLLNQGDEDSLECLCCLLTTIGKELKNEKKTNAALMENYFTDIRKIVDKRQTRSTIRIMLQDVMDLRANNWIPCLDESNPKTIDQIRREAESLEAYEEQVMHQKMAYDCDRWKNQWSSLNCEGKKQYDREFLLNLQSHPLAMKKPSDLPNLDVTKDKESPGGLFQKKQVCSRTLEETGKKPEETGRNGGNRKKLEEMEETRRNWNKLPENEKDGRNLSESPNYSRQNASRQVPNMTRSSITTVVSQSAPPTLQQYGTVPLYSQQAAYTMSPQPTVLMPPHVINYQHSNFAAPHQFSMPSSQAQMYHLASASNNWNSYNQTAAVFQVQAGPKKIANYKGLPIIDPATGRDLREFIPNKPSSQGAKDGIQCKLEFTTKHIAEPKLRKQITPEELKQNLQRLLCDHESNEEIFNWLERHIEGEMSPLMYRALVTVIYESVITGAEANCELNVSKLKERMCILARYMDVNRNLELHAIFALQYLMNKLRHPKGILLQIFDLAYNEDFLSDDAFKQWEHCDDPAEQEGKDLAIRSVSSFYTWLKEGEDDESAEGD